MTPTPLFANASWSSASASTPSSLPPGSSPSSPPCTVDGSGLRVPLAVFYSLFFVLGLAGNLFALWVFLFVHARHNSVRVFLINCAVADLVLLACLPFRVFYHLSGDSWALGSAACRAVGTVFYMNMYVSILLLGLISMDRYVRLRDGGRTRGGAWSRLQGRNQLCGKVVCGAVWSLFLVGMVFIVATKEDGEGRRQCFQYRQRLDSRWKGYVNIAVVVLFWSVFVMLIVSYARIASRLLQLSRNKPELPNAQKYKKTAQKSFFVLFLFTVCFVPYHTFRPVYIFSQLGFFPGCDFETMVDRTNEILLLLSTFNSCLDPVMYFLLSGSVRRTALQVLGRRFAGRLPFVQDMTFNSSTMEYRRASAPLPDQLLHNPSLTPRTSFCVVNASLRRSGADALAAAGAPPTPGCS